MSISELPIQFVMKSATAIAASVREGELSASEVLEAHLAKIDAINPTLNAVVVRCSQAARDQAAEIDRAQARGESLGPLAGVPITLKESFHLAGTAATMGLRRLANNIATEDSPLVARLKQAGAIVVGKTNVPQLMLLHETDNGLYGRTNHPLRPAERSPGGSSGGEAAIISGGGVPLGLGSDMGGSIRQPAHSCGICGFKPTGGCLPNAGSLRTLHGMEAIPLQAGPLARTVEDLILALKVLVGEPATVDSSLLPFTCLPPVPWRDPTAVAIRGLRIAVWNDDGYFRPAPAIRRAVDEAADVLTRAGAVVKPFRPPAVDEAMRLYFSLISADGAASFRRSLGDEPPDFRIAQLLSLAGMSRVSRTFWMKLARIGGNTRLADMMSAIRVRSADEYWWLIDQRNRYVEQFFAALGGSQSTCNASGTQVSTGTHESNGTRESERFDCMIFPPHALPALRHRSTRLAPAASYCFLPNLLDIPSGVIPWTRVQSGEESDRVPGRDRSELAAIEVERGSAGLPVGVQVAALPWRDDVVLAVMQALERLRSQGMM